MSMPSPPKPWERNGATPATSAPSLPSQSAPTLQSSPPPSTSTPAVDPTPGAPSVPLRPASIASQTATSTNLATRTTAAPGYSSMTTPYASPYSTYGASGSYMSPYNRVGAYGAGGYGGYGSTYGSYGSGYGGYGGVAGGYGMSPYGMPGAVDPLTGQPSLIQQVESSTSQTFALIQSIVGTFTGFAQMLDSTFMATQSSFFAMLGVAEQFGQLRMALGQVVGLFGFVGWLRGWWRGDRANLRSDFRRFLKGEDLGGQAGGAPKPSKKPLIIFLVAVFGLPYLMHRIIRHIASRLPPPPPVQLGPDGQPLPRQIIDPANLTFVRAIYPFETKDAVELSLSKGELVAVLATTDPATGVEGEWWQGRTRDGREGWFPRNFVEIVKQKKMEGDATPSTPAPVKIVE